MQWTNRVKGVPEALLIQPRIYDFALYDLFFKPYGLLRLAGWLASAGYRLRVLNGLDYRDEITLHRRGPVQRNSNGTGKFPRRLLSLSDPIPGGGTAFSAFRRRFAEETSRYMNLYGIETDSLRAQVEAARPDIVLITSQMTYWYPGVREAVDLVRKIHPGVPVAVGGVYASLMPEHCGSVMGADAVVSGNDLFPLRTLLNHRSLPSPPCEPPEQPLMVEGMWKDAGVLRLNRGCPNNCPYCASKRIEPEFVEGSGERLWRRVMEMHRLFGTESFAFYDDALLFSKEKALVPFLERAVSSKKRFSFYLPNAVHLRYIDQRTADLMFRVGFEEVRLGYESAYDASPASSSKYERDSVQGVVEALLSAGFPRERIVLYILAGLPRQTAGEVEQTIYHASRLGVRLTVAEYSPVPGSGLWKENTEVSRYPIEDEPLFQNNTIFPLEWEKFTREDMARLKALSREFPHRG